MPEGEIWAGDAQRVIAKTLDGDIGVLTGHTPVLGILAEGSVVRILPEDGQGAGGEMLAAVGGGFLSVADDRVSVLARQAQLGTEVDRAGAQAALDAAHRGSRARRRGDRGRPVLPSAAQGRWRPGLTRTGAEGWVAAALETRRSLAPGRAAGPRAGRGTGIAIRRILLERGGGIVECGLRRGPDQRWRLGLAAYQPDELRWYDAFGVLLRPRAIFARAGSAWSPPGGPADAWESASLGPGMVVVECSAGASTRHRWNWP